jgi:Stealth protein CR2, conserved region 2/Stealth protein CR3, conserved region 3/Stealth protein CR4, conserved region 4/Stealth protein CR1, conserved region 1
MAQKAFRPPARSRLLRLYETAVPRRLRIKIKSRLSPRWQSRLIRGATGNDPITRTLDVVFVSVRRLRHRRWLRTEGIVFVHSDGVIRLATVLNEPTPLAAQRRNRATVMAMLDRAGLHYFTVRGYDDHSSAVAVASEHRDAVIRAIRLESQRWPLYVAEILEPLPGVGKQALADEDSSIRGPIIRLFQFYTDASGVAVTGAEAGCDIEFWSELDGYLQAPRPNRAADVVSRQSTAVMAAETVFSGAVSDNTADIQTLPTVPEMLGRLLDDITFDIDVVYTWVDGSNPSWQARRDHALGLSEVVLNGQATNDSRFINRDELRYSLRSLYMFAPWVRQIWLVTDDQVPSWLATDHPKVKVVSHRELFGDRGLLPTFNSHAIESQLHRIEGLSEHFLYLNDDVFLGRPVTPSAFFHANGVTKFFPSKAKVDPGAVDVVRDIPATAAGKNNRRLIEQLFGRSITYKMKHTPHALRRSVLAEIESVFPKDLARTAAHQFRNPADISLVSSLYQYYTTFSGRSVRGDIRYMYADLEAPTTTAMLWRTLTRRDFDVFCLNDTDSSPQSLSQQQRLMEEFLTAYFPYKAPWEIEPPPVSKQLSSSQQGLAEQRLVV